MWLRALLICMLVSMYMWVSICVFIREDLMYRTVRICFLEVCVCVYVYVGVPVDVSLQASLIMRVDVQAYVCTCAYTPTRLCAYALLN